ncbi:MAG: 2-dehydropantoate 2-reductase [Lachnospiraceae bacterium]|nr:2-dehydropantoate 2-reductase [Lachnospiraceae bacterium]
MKYLIIGAGGTGGLLGYKLTKGGKDVTLIARGEHLKAIQEHGLTIHKIWDEQRESLPVKAVPEAEYQERPDVILVCVKGYSLDSVYPLIRRVAGPDTVVIPILNIYGTGGRMQEELPGILVTDGCIYVSANIESPGVLLQHGEICRVVFGVRNKDEYRPVLADIAADLEESGIRGVLSENIQRDALQKFSYVSPIGAVGLHYQCAAGEIQKEGEPREMFKAMIREIIALAGAMDIHFEQDLVEVNLNILSELAPEATTSMQRDVMAGKDSEIDGLVYQVVRLGKKYGVPMPQYEKAAAELRRGMQAK